jgi:hypothetical protein
VEESLVLKIVGGSDFGYCDRISRRQFLQIGGLAMGGLALPDLLLAEEAQGGAKRHKAVIMVYMPGGPPHQDMFDLKLDAPSDIRGDFKPIKTNVPGIEICEHLPRLAKMMDRVAVIRSLVGARDEHDSHMCMTGYTSGEQAQNHAPDFGSVVARLQGPTDPTVPPFVNLAKRTQHMPYNDPGTGFLGQDYGALNPNGPMMPDLTLQGITLDRLADRRRMLSSFDRFRRKVDSTKGFDGLQERAFSILTSSKVVNALDLGKEDPKVRSRYGKGTDGPVGDGSPMTNDHFLAALRLVQAGVRVVTISYGFWDFHGGNFSSCKQYLPMFDQAICSLIEDIHARGLEKDVSVVAWGEFGRSPRINKDAGRDHWPRVSCCLLAGGGMKTGQVIGTTNRFGEEPDERPVHYRDVFATLYRNLGIDIANTGVLDTLNRPNYLFAQHEPVAELI